MVNDAEARRMATRAQQDLNSYQAKQGLGPQSDSAAESGVNEMAERKFQEADVRYGGRDAIPSGSDRKPIPEDEGGIRDDRGRLAQAQQFEGRGGPEDKIERE
ncbi:hypothetical protein ASPVEDRAFT_139464 [Aspergillus versicolor CBS 583.65]|uniref:Uncharacterized protein n=1 Tax=Aspergillus versicolor CBS 583.65 TaxID=1036611 RepID=A0A1L9PX60_ASPVE|nr:uncharacterized protein ASPVEDRAFT_139464 [Aspergillus versicolor CBS 583.65]OJJ06043.1 hypothetical protein ASPVEDRAFT_139464 [Aspergillus versicolor CBS 583.65]